MSSTTTTPYMSLSLPNVGVEVGPQWASELNTAFTAVDSHTHVTGQGLPIPTAGIQINADLSFNTNYNLTTFRSLRAVNQSAALALSTDINCIYVSGGNLYYNDLSGNQIQMTVGGAVNTSGAGSISGLGATTATVAYSAGSKTFTFWSNTNTPAKMVTGPLTFSQNAASPYTVTLTIANAQATNYTITMPSVLPSTAGYVQMDTSGNLTIQGVVVPGVTNGLVSLNGLTGATAGSAISAGYVGQVIYGPANKNTGSLISFTSSGAWKNFQSIVLSAGVWWVVANMQIQPGDNSTVFSLSTSIDFNISASSASGTGANGNFACIDYNSMYMTNNLNVTGNIGSGTIGTVLTPSGSTTYYLNINCTYTGTAPTGRGGMMAVRIA